MSEVSGQPTTTHNLIIPISGNTPIPKSPINVLTKPPNTYPQIRIHSIIVILDERMNERTNDGVTVSDCERSFVRSFVHSLTVFVRALTHSE
mgnify:CR=1 FL=1